MTDVSTLPAPSISQEWDGVDTSIDAEPPELLSEDQFDRHIETVTALLTTAGLHVRTPDEREPATLEVANRATGYTVELDLRDDRSAEWGLTASDEIPEGTPALDVAMTIAHLLHAPAPG